jgi:hypothetical protein
LRVTGGYLKAGTRFLKRVTGRILRIQYLNDFLEKSRNFIFNFFQKKAAKYTKSTELL